MNGVRKALVTGGSAGLGSAFCEILSDSGWHVTNVDRRRPGAVCGDHVGCDLGDREAVDLLITDLVAAGPFDLVILNAGISASGGFETIPLEAHRRVIAVNAESPIVLCTGLARAGGLARGGSVIFISSLSHQTGYPGAASYAAAKGAVAAYAKSIRTPFKRDLGVSVSCAFPGPLRTDHAARHAPPDADAGKRTSPERAARLILSDAARGRAVILPGTGAKLFAAAGRILPGPVTRAMRRITYDKLDRDVW